LQKVQESGSRVAALDGRKRERKDGRWGDRNIETELEVSNKNIADNDVKSRCLRVNGNLVRKEVSIRKTAIRRRKKMSSEEVCQYSMRQTTSKTLTTKGQVAELSIEEEWG